jgi:hypothetical protein
MITSDSIKTKVHAMCENITCREKEDPDFVLNALAELMHQIARLQIQIDEIRECKQLSQTFGGPKEQYHKPCMQCGRDAPKWSPKCKKCRLLHDRR